MNIIKKLMTLSAAVILSSGALRAQSLLSEETKNAIGGGLGYTMIDNVPYMAFTVTPDLALGPVGVGVDLTLRLNMNDYTIRASDWDKIDDLAKVVRYVRVGSKDAKAFDFLYARIGNLSNSNLGHGILMYNFSNSPSLDNRRMGMEFDLDFTNFGLEGIYSDMIDPSVMGARLYIRPIKWTSLADVPIIGGFEIGGTYVTDNSTDSSIVTSTYNAGTPDKNLTSTGNNLSAYAFDLGLPLIETDIFKFEFYYDWAKYVDYGSGMLAGAYTKTAIPGNILTLEAKLERRWLDDQFIPSYFNALYLVNRYQPATASSNAVIGRDALKTAIGSGGIYGELGLSFLEAFQIIGGYQQADTNNDGILHLEAVIPPKMLPNLEFSASYDKVGIQGFKNAFSLDENSLLSAMIGYHPIDFILIGARYNWTFVPVGNDQYETQTQIEAIFNVSYEFE